jgi:SAM-dependent methyltransferase
MIFKRTNKDKQPDYKDRVEHQIAQFADKEALVGRPKVMSYWNKRYVVPKLIEVFGENTIWKIYANAFIEAGKRIDSKAMRILSIGCGDCLPDIEIAKAMISAGASNFIILATELSSLRIERAKANVINSNLEGYFEFKVVDVNEWNTDDCFTGILSHHTLHHIAELERLFRFINRTLDDEGVFVVVDMIGRNGHMRWPETLDVVEMFWKILPEEYKYNHQFKKFMLEYVNWDCAHKGFEGIRAQDILPLLCENFSFTHFLGVGGFVDVFVDRGFGHNFSIDDEKSLAYINIIAQMNDAMLISGEIKPTTIYAICQKKSLAKNEKCFLNLTTEAAIRKIIPA